MKIAFLADTHLGYAAKCSTDPETGINQRVLDGYKGFRETITQIIENNVDTVIHGGDLFHRSHPTITDIVFAKQQLARLSQANIPFYGNTGNHDFANERGKYPATAAVADPGQNITMLTGPEQTLQLDDTVKLTMISHVGVIASDKKILPEPDPGFQNILTTHGAAAVPGHEMFTCVDSPGEAVIDYATLTQPWDITLLGHYHQMGPLPGFDTGATGQAWYAGSLLRRGFSDKEGGRGWLLVTTDPTGTGTVTVERKNVHQRPQHDLPLIDAEQMNATEVEDTILYNLENIDIPDAIIRQRIINIPLSVRRTIDNKKIKTITTPALVWQPEYVRPSADTTYTDLDETETHVTSLATAKASDLPHMWDNWFDQYNTNQTIPNNISDTVKTNGKTLLQKVSEAEENNT